MRSSTSSTNAVDFVSLSCGACLCLLVAELGSANVQTLKERKHTERRTEEEEDVFWKRIRRSDPKTLREHDVILKNTPSGTYLV